MRVTFDEAWRNTRDLYIFPTNGVYKLSCLYRGKEIHTYVERWCGEVATYEKYRTMEYYNAFPTTRAERKEYTEAYKYLCELVIYYGNK